MADEPVIEPDPAPEADPAPDPTDAPATDPAAEEDPFAPIEGEPASFPREYVEKLRREGAKYRTTAKERADELERLKPYEEAFSGWEPEQVDAWGGFLQAAKDDPNGAIAALMKDGFAYDKESAQALLAQMFEEDDGQDPAPTSEPPAGGDDPDRPLTLRDLETREAAKQAEAEQAAAVNQVKQDAKDLGYTPDASPDTLDAFRYQRLLHLAAHVTGNDLKKAHEALVAEEQAAAKQRMEELAQEAESLPVPSGNGGPGAVEAAPADWDSTRRGASEFLAAARTANP